MVLRNLTFNYVTGAACRSRCSLDNIAVSIFGKASLSALEGGRAAFIDFQSKPLSTLRANLCNQNFGYLLGQSQDLLPTGIVCAHLGGEFVAQPG